MHIQGTDLTKAFGDKTAVDSLNIEMRKGQTLGLLGPNGSGKSTTIKMLTSQLEPTSGVITYDDKPITQMKNEINATIGIMPQEIIIWEHLSVIENLKFSATLFGLDKKRTKERTEFLLEKLHLSTEGNKLARNLSGGYKRRLHLAISIVHDPKVIFLDEPTPGIDPQSRRAMWDFLDELKQTGEYSILLTDHYLDEAEKACDYIIIMDDGKVVAEGTMKDLRKGHGEGKFITLDMIEPSKAFIDDISKQFKNAIFVDKKLSIPTLEPEKDIPILLHEMNKFSIRFDDLAIKEPSLEDIFLVLTGKKVRE